MHKIHTENNMDRAKQIKFFYNFIKEHKLAVMATVTGDALPEASVLGIAVNQDLELICSSFSTSRKFNNLKNNPRVALVIGWEKGKTLQYEGQAEEISIEQAEQNPLAAELENIPSIAKYVNREFGVFYKIKPLWLRFTDLSVDPWDRFEIKF